MLSRGIAPPREGREGSLQPAVQEYDRGPILAQRTAEVRPQDTAGGLGRPQSYRRSTGCSLGAAAGLSTRRRLDGAPLPAHTPSSRVTQRLSPARRGKVS